MANQTFKYYVGVFTKKGFRFVTKTNYFEEIAEWNDGEKAKKFNLKQAKYIHTGLIVNGFNAVIVKAFKEQEFINDIGDTE